jgi:hypothetical protein
MARDRRDTKLTSVECALVDHVERGELLDLAGDRPVDEVAMRSWDTARTVRAEVIRDIMRGRLAPEPDPHGVRLRGARIAGRVDLENITCTLWLELCDCFLDEGLNARDAHLAGLVLTGSRLEHPSMPPLALARVTARNVQGERATIVAHSTYGAISMIGASIGAFRLPGAKLYNDLGPALRGERLEVASAVLLNEKFEATGAGENGSIDLNEAHLGSLDLSSARLRNASGPSLTAEQLQVDQSVNLNECEVVGGGDAVSLDLAGARINGFLFFRLTRLEHHDHPRRRLLVDGLIYAGAPRGISAKAWLTLIREGTPLYAAQPYQQLAAGHRAAGDDTEARRVQMAQRRDQIIHNALRRRSERTWVRFIGLTLGYGYQPWRALLGLLGAFVVAAILTSMLGADGGLAQVRTPTVVPAPPCTLVQRIGVGLDLGNPVISTGARARCDYTDTTIGAILTASGWVLRLLIWAFATLFIAGFTGVVRKA